MYFFIDENNKIIIGWSPKCGSTHVKKLFCFLTGQDVYSVTHKKELPVNHSDYKIILIMRNPFERVVSAFRFLYKQGGYCRASIILSPDQKITFRDFVDELVSKGTHDPLKHTTILAEHSKFNIDKFHFDPQVSGLLPQIDVHKIYDILNIDYSYIETLYGKTIPQEIRNFKGPNVNLTPLQTKYGLREKLQLSGETETKVFDLEVDKTQTQNLSLTQFYNQDIANKVAEFYKIDLEFIEAL